MGIPIYKLKTPVAEAHNPELWIYIGACAGRAL